MNYDFIPSLECSTKWAKSWAKNYADFSKSNELMVYSNVRGVIAEAQYEFERHLSNLMNHQAHQSEY